MSIIDFSISRTRTVIATLILILIAGTYSYITIPKESDPDIDIPIIYVSMYLEGVSPDDSERLLVRPMEQEMTAIEGLKELRSSAYTGGGNIVLEFQAGFDKDQALDDVQKAVDQARPELPTDVEEPKVSEVNFSLFPVLAVMLHGDVPERMLLKLADNLQDKIEAVNTVLEVNISGDREELVEILIDPVVLESYGLDGPQLIQFFQRSNQLVAAGNLDTGNGKFAVKVPGLFETFSDLLDMPLRTDGDSVVTVRDIAEIRRSYKDVQNLARINGERAVALNIVKRTGENVIDTIAAVREVVDGESVYWPEGVEVSYTLDKSNDIRNMLTDLQNNIISAILLVMIVCVAALGFRSALLVGIAIPGSFLSGILIISVLGLTVNVVVLFSLILSVGMLVDGAIVVTEYADRKMNEGMNRVEAYTRAAKRMAWPIIASTATTLAAFAPLLFWPGTAGEFMKYMPMTLIGVLLSSLAMALIFVPVLGSVIGKPSQQGDHAIDPDSRENLDNAKGFMKFYLNVLRGAMKVPLLMLIGVFVLLIGVQVAYSKFGKGVEFFPEIEPEFAKVLVQARGNMSVLEQSKLVQQVEQKIIGRDGLKLVYSEIGKTSEGGNDEAPADTIGQITLEFTPWDMRKTADEILDDIRADTSQIPGLLIQTRKMQGGPPTGKALQLNVSSRFPELIYPTIDKIYRGLEEVGDFIDVEDSRPLPGIEWELNVDRAQASKFGIDLSVIGQYVRLVTNGLKVSDYRPNDSDEEIDIVIRHRDEDRTLAQLDKIRIESDGFGSVPISNFVERVPQDAVGTINRVDQKRVITIQADLPPEINVAAKIEEVRAWIEENADSFDPRVSLDFKGQDEDQQESMMFLMKAFLVALFIMAIILVTQFNSFYSAFLILTAVIMSTIGVFIGLMVIGQPFGVIMSGTGVIALAGIIVNNNIVLIDTFDYLHKKKGLSVSDAILMTGFQRLRPVMLTTITTVCGLLPMVTQTNIDFITREVTVGAPSTQWWVQLATAIVFGLTFSTILTLVVTPSALMLRYTLGEKVKWVKRKLSFNKK
jgi:multidrug efflux pump